MAPKPRVPPLPSFDLCDHNLLRVYPDYFSAEFTAQPLSDWITLQDPFASRPSHDDTPEVSGARLSHTTYLYLPSTRPDDESPVPPAPTTTTTSQREQAAIHILCDHTIYTVSGAQLRTRTGSRGSRGKLTCCPAPPSDIL